MNFDSMLMKIITGKAPCAVGIDIAENELSAEFLEKYENGAEAVLAYSKLIIDSVCEYVCAVAINVPVFLQYGKEMMQSLFSYAKEKDLYVIADAKCSGDFASSESESVFYFDILGADAVTASPYFGMDGLQPFLEKCEKDNKNIFVISHSSEGSPRDVQELMAGMRMVYRAVCEKVHLRGEKRVGNYGYSDIGIMIGGVSNKTLHELRHTYKKTFFMLTGYNGETISAHDLTGAFDTRGLGGIVLVSRPITNPDAEGDFAEKIRTAAEKVARDLKLCF